MQKQTCYLNFHHMNSISSLYIFCFLAIGIGLLTCSGAENIPATISACPDGDLITPCSCDDLDADQIVTTCDTITNVEVLEGIFRRGAIWKMMRLELAWSSVLYIPSSIFTYTSIEELYVTGSTLVSLFEKPVTSNSLRRLVIRDSVFLRGIQWNLFSELNLTYISIENTRIKRLGKFFRDGVPASLQDLYLSRTNITKISSDSLVRLEKLEFISIINGELKNIDNLKFPKSVKLIDFSNNHLQSLTDGIFNDLPRLAKVRLHKNLLATIKKDVFLGIIGNQFINLVGNPIKCNCNLKWMFSSGINRQKIDATCASASASKILKSLKGKKINELKATDFAYCT